MKQCFKYIFIFCIFFTLFGCNRHFTKFHSHRAKNKKIPSLNILPQVQLSKDSITKLISISTIDRKNPHDEGGFAWIPYAKVTNRLDSNTFKLIVKYFDKIKQNKEYPILYEGSGINDSIYSTIYDKIFTTTYHHQMMQGINFSNKIDGLYLVITFILKRINGFGGGPSGGGGAASTSNTLYEFFQIKDGAIIAYTGYSLARADSFRSISQKGFPKYKDLKWVLKRLYK
jgi:hypothetical protein